MFGRDPHDPPPGLATRVRRLLHPALALLAGSCLLAQVGWTGAITPWLHAATVANGLLLALLKGWEFFSTRDERVARRRPSAAVLPGVLLIASLALQFQPSTGEAPWLLLWHAAVQLTVVATGISSALRHQSRFTARAFHPGLLLILSFLAVILVGALLLKMPRCMMPGSHCSWVDALFTSTSAVCVTGLVVLNTATDFSLTGQVVILVLIQTGGLGIMTLSFFAVVALFEGLSLHDRLLLGRMIQDRRIARVGRTLSFIIGMTFVCESLGALVLLLSSGGDPASPVLRLFQAVFHSVSAFCNAGFSTHSGGLADPVVAGNVWWQVTIMCLIIIGGLGAFVIEDLWQALVTRLHRRRGERMARHRLSVHTRWVLKVTAILILGGAAAIFTSEFLLASGPRNGGTILTALFHSVTARTAGFNTVPMPQVGVLTLQILMVLMFIGGSPGGTAGGVRTTVVGVGLAQLWCQLRETKGELHAFNRTIPRETGARALGLIVLAVLWLTTNFLILRQLESSAKVSDTTLLFELISAFATVGLSVDLTPTLGDPAKLLLVVNMFVGRVGLLTVFTSLIRPDPRPASGKPAEDIVLT